MLILSAQLFSLELEQSPKFKNGKWLGKITLSHSVNNSKSIIKYKSTISRNIEERTIIISGESKYDDNMSKHKITIYLDKKNHNGYLFQDQSDTAITNGRIKLVNSETIEVYNAERGTRNLIEFTYDEIKMIISEKSTLYDSKGKIVHEAVSDFTYIQQKK